MGCKIIFGPQALADLEKVVRHIARENPAVAEGVGNELIDRALILQNFPLLGSLYSKKPGVRKLVSRPYIIFYRAKPEEGRVEILRYWHGARREPELTE